MLQIGRWCAWIVQAVLGYDLLDHVYRVAFANPVVKARDAERQTSPFATVAQL